MREIKQIIVHHSESDRPAHDNIETIREWHIERGFDDVGYHYVISKSKGIQQGRAEAVKGAHCYGQNGDSIGICLCGDSEFSTGQFEDLASLLKELFERYVLTFDDVYPHNYYSEKECPNFDLLKFNELYLKKIIE